MVIFAIVCTAIVDMLISSTSITTYAKQKTVAEEGVSNQIAYIRSLDYNSQIGLSGGNPAGNSPRRRPSTASTARRSAFPRR